MKILVTGSHGVIGTALVVELKNRGHTVIGCDLGHDRSEVGISVQTDAPAPNYIRCDVSEFRQLEKVFSVFHPFDLVYHTAAEFGRWNGQDFYETLWKTNVIGTNHLLRLQKDPPFCHFRLVHFSSSEVYGDYIGTMSEHVMNTATVQQLNDYAMTKWVNEMQIRNSPTASELTVIVRLFNTYGPGEFYSPYRSVNCRFLYSALHGYPWTVFSGHSRTSTYLPDAIRTLANIANRFIPGSVYNIGGGQLHTIEELSNIVLEITGAAPALVNIRASEFQTTKTKVPNTTKARVELDHHETVGLREGLTATMNWMRQIYFSGRQP